MPEHTLSTEELSTKQQQRIHINLETIEEVKLKYTLIEETEQVTE